MASPTCYSHKSRAVGRVGVSLMASGGASLCTRGASPVWMVSALVSPLAGELVYNGTHGDTCYYVNCSLNCKLEIFNWSCPSTSSPTPSPSTTTTYESSTSNPVVPGCPDLDPPREVCVCG